MGLWDIQLPGFLCITLSRHTLWVPDVARVKPLRNTKTSTISSQSLSFSSSSSFPLHTSIPPPPHLHRTTPNRPSLLYNQERAAKAAQASQKGKLGRDLARDKAQSMNGALGSASREERRRRDVDEGTEARNWN